MTRSYYGKATTVCSHGIVIICPASNFGSILTLPSLAFTEGQSKYFLGKIFHILYLAVSSRFWKECLIGKFGELQPVRRFTIEKDNLNHLVLRWTSDLTNIKHCHLVSYLIKRNKNKTFSLSQDAFGHVGQNPE